MTSIRWKTKQGHHKNQSTILPKYFIFVKTFFTHQYNVNKLDIILHVYFDANVCLPYITCIIIHLIIAIQENS